MEYRYCPLCAQELVKIREPNDDRERPACPTGHFVHYEGMSSGVNALICHDNQILLQRRAIEPGLGLWDLAGGYLERGEWPEDGARREAWEETGLQVEIKRLLGVRSGKAVTVVYYEAVPAGGELRCSAESYELRWFPVDQIPWDTIAFSNARSVISEWSSGRLDTGAP